MAKNGYQRIFLFLIPPKNRLDLYARIIGSVVCLLVGKILHTLTPLLYKSVIDFFKSNSETTSNSSYWIWIFIFLYGMGELLNYLFANLSTSLFFRVQQFSYENSCLKAFEHLQSLSLRYHSQRKTGTVMKIMERGANGFSFLTTFLFMDIVPLLLEIVLICTIFFIFQVAGLWLILLTLFTIFIYLLFTFIVTEWRTKIRKKMNETDNNAADKAFDTLMNFETVKTFCNEKHELKRYSSALRAYGQSAERFQYVLDFLSAGQSMLIALSQMVAMYIAAAYVFQNIMTAGDLVLITTYIGNIYQPLKSIGNSYKLIRKSLVDAEALLKIIEEPLEIVDAIHPIRPIDSIEGNIRFEDVQFQYDLTNEDSQILKGISFQVTRGKQLAICGSSGGGKTTISRLLFRFYEPTSGSIFLDDFHIQQLTQEELRSQLGIVSQDCVLFNDTIRYNIQYGNLNASEEELIEAAQVAKIYDFILNLPNGWDTIVGERGIRLSGGERQRVSIARCVLKKTPIVVFDEATSSLDLKTEQEIQENLKQVFRGKTTTIVLAHRLSTIVDSDEILVLKHGLIVERGNFEQLMQLPNGEFQSLWNKQMKHHNS